MLMCKHSRFHCLCNLWFPVFGQWLCDMEYVIFERGMLIMEVWIFISIRIIRMIFISSWINVINNEIWASMCKYWPLPTEPLKWVLTLAYAVFFSVNTIWLDFYLWYEPAFIEKKKTTYLQVNRMKNDKVRQTRRVHSVSISL